MNLKRRLFLKLFALTNAALFVNPAYAAATKRAAPKTVTELYSTMSSLLPVGKSTAIQWSVTGEKYVEYALGIDGPESGGPPINAEAKLCDSMWRTFKAQLAHINERETPSLYWRIRPEYAEYDDDVGPFSGFDLSRSQLPKLRKARIYLRYLISSKPAVFTEDRLISGWHRNNYREPMQ